METKKAYLQIDFLFLFLSFLVLFSFVYFFYSNYYSSYSESLFIKETKEKLNYICNTLTLTTGAPKNWEYNSLDSTVFFGLREENSSIMDSLKYDVFFNSSNFLDIYDHYNFSSLFYFKVYNSSGDLIKFQGALPYSPQDSISESCFISNQSNILILEVGVWE